MTLWHPSLALGILGHSTLEPCYREAVDVLSKIQVNFGHRCCAINKRSLHNLDLAKEKYLKSNNNVRIFSFFSTKEKQLKPKFASYNTNIFTYSVQIKFVICYIRVSVLD